MMIISRVICASIAALAMMLGACAATVRPGMASLLIKRGEPSVSYDDPDQKKPAAAVSDTSAAEALPQQPWRERLEPGTTVESTDKALGDALRSLKGADNAGNQMRVAAEYRRLRILDQAYEHATRALDEDDRLAAAYEQRAQIWREWGFPQLGLTDAHRAVFMAPRSPSAHNTLGTLLQSVGALDGARRHYLRVLDLDPDAAYAWSNLCYLSLVTDNAQRGITECEAALAKQPGLDAALNNMALTYAAADRLDEALVKLRAVSDSADGAYNVGLLYFSLGKYRLAEQAFRTAADIRPNFTAAHTRRRQAAIAAGRSKTHDYSHHR
jgi:tetratricopeptide (TPR) repeat protein